MGGATILCGSFEGNDKSGSPIASVLEEAFFMAFNKKPRGRLRIRLAKLIGQTRTSHETQAEEAILQVKFNEEGEILSAVSRLLLPYLEQYQAMLIKKLGIEDNVDQIWEHVSTSIAAKYGKTPDPGWHLYCLHDLVPAFKKSAAEDISVQVVW